MKKKAYIAAGLILATLIGVFLLLKNKKTGQETTTSSASKKSLPINQIPVTDRPFITLTPDASGRNLTLLVDSMTSKGVMEYELVYSAIDKQEGAFGRIDFASAVLPVEKVLLLGSKSGGGKVTYHEGVTGGSLTVTYDDTRLKESFNFLRFDPSDSELSSVDARFTATLEAKALKKNTVVVIMKTFGLPDSLEGSIIAGPYGIFSPFGLEEFTISIRLPSGDHANPTIYAFKEGSWEKLDTVLEDDVISAINAVGTTFVVTTN